MNKRGYTLIEVMATVLVLATISLISYPVLTNILQNNQDTEIKTFKENAVLAAKTYFNLNNTNNSSISSKKVSVNRLITEGFLDKPNFKYDYTKDSIECLEECQYMP